MENQPPMGRMMAFETRYEVSTQVDSSMPAERLPAIFGRDTLTTVVSSTSMKVASMTVMATIQGLMTGTGLLLGVHGLHLADGVRQVGAGLVITIEGGDLVVAGAGQLVLGGNDFDVVGHAGLEAVAGLYDFLLGEVDAQVGDVHFRARGLQLGEGRLDFEGDAVAELLFLLAKLADGEIGLGALGLNLSPCKQRNVDAALVYVDRNGTRGREPLLGPKAVEGELGKPGRVGGFQIELGASFASEDLAQLGARGVSAVEGLIRGNLRGVEEAHLVGEFNLPVRLDVEQAREAEK